MSEVVATAARRCGGCDQPRPLTAFTKHKGRADGLSFYCDVCRKGLGKKYRKVSADKIKAYRTKYVADHVAWELLRRARHRAKKKGLPFNLSIEDVQVPEFCPILGIKLARNNAPNRDSSASLDRIRPELGYVKGNICVISLRANRIKNDATPEEMMAVAAWFMKQEAH